MPDIRHLFSGIGFLDSVKRVLASAMRLVLPRREAPGRGCRMLQRVLTVNGPRAAGSVVFGAKPETGSREPAAVVNRRDPIPCEVERKRIPPTVRRAVGRQLSASAVR